MRIGPHAPMGDYLSADAIAERIARRAGERGVETLIAPALPFGGADYFGSMQGGISLTQPTLRGAVRGCLVRHGLTRLIVINGHGGNVQAIHDATQPFWVQRQILIPSFYLWRVGYGLLPGIVGDQSKLVSGHGADPLTSVAMHLFPELMRPELVPGPEPLQQVMGMPATAFGVVRFEGAEIAVPVEYHEIAPQGVRAGDARLCSAETGEKLVEHGHRPGRPRFFPSPKRQAKGSKGRCPWRGSKGQRPLVGSGAKPWSCFGSPDCPGGRVLTPLQPLPAPARRAVGQLGQDGVGAAAVPPPASLFMGGVAEPSQAAPPFGKGRGRRLGADRRRSTTGVTVHGLSHGTFLSAPPFGARPRQRLGADRAVPPPASLFMG